MRLRIPALAAAAILAFGLSACGTDNGGAETTPTPVAPATQATTEPAEATPEATADATAGADAEAGDQSTPEAAVHSALAEVANGDAAAACEYVAFQNQPVSENPDAMQACEQQMQGMVQSFGPAAGTVRVSGATVDGDQASFVEATVEPAEAQQIVGALQAVRIDEKWYITQGN